MPVFDNELDDDKQPGVVARRAIATYQALLPNHSIKMIDMTSMKKLQGELHCLSLHVPKFAPMPKLLYRYDDAVKYYLNP